MLKRDDVEEEEEEGMLNEEDLVEAKVSWDVGEALGLRVSNKRAMIVALSKVS